MKNKIMEIIIKASGNGSNNKYRTGAFSGEILIEVDAEDIEYVVEKKDYSDFGFIEETDYIQTIKDLSKENLEEFTYRYLIDNHKAPKDEIRELCYSDDGEGESEMLYWFENYAEELNYKILSINQKFPPIDIVWEIITKII